MMENNNQNIILPDKGQMKKELINFLKNNSKIIRAYEFIAFLAAFWVMVFFVPREMALEMSTQLLMVTVILLVVVFYNIIKHGQHKDEASTTVYHFELNGLLERIYTDFIKARQGKDEKICCLLGEECMFFYKDAILSYSDMDKMYVANRPVRLFKSADFLLAMDKNKFEHSVKQLSDDGDKIAEAGETIAIVLSHNPRIQLHPDLQQFAVPIPEEEESTHIREYDEFYEDVEYDYDDEDYLDEDYDDDYDDEYDDDEEVVESYEIEESEE